ITVQWISGHNGVAGNKLADGEAKQAAESQSESSPRQHLPPYLHKGILPCSISALKQVQKQESSKCWARFWQKSPQY
ncbi:hypothetical protein BDR04DRAFT_954491, partial [Suillus decipiens]